jgi:hypothetical protein
VLGIVYRCIATHVIKKAGFTRKTAQAGAVTLIQRFGSALNLNVHFHMLFLDGVYVERPDGVLRFHWVKQPTGSELARLTENTGIAHRLPPRTPGVAGVRCGEQLPGWRRARIRPDGTTPGFVDDVHGCTLLRPDSAASTER